MVWDPFGTLASALWIAGGQWAGKSTTTTPAATRTGGSQSGCDAASRRNQLSTLDRAASATRSARSATAWRRLVAADAVRSANALGIRVIEVDGSVPAEDVTDLVAEHFGLAAS